MVFPPLAELWSLIAGSFVVGLVVYVVAKSPPPHRNALIMLALATPFFAFGTGSKLKVDMWGGKIDVSELEPAIKKAVNESLVSSANKTDGNLVVETTPDAVPPLETTPRLSIPFNYSADTGQFTAGTETSPYIAAAYSYGNEASAYRGGFYSRENIGVTVGGEYSPYSTASTRFDKDRLAEGLDLSNTAAVERYKKCILKAKTDEEKLGCLPGLLTQTAKDDAETAPTSTPSESPSSEKQPNNSQAQ